MLSSFTVPEKAICDCPSHRQAAHEAEHGATAHHPAHGDLNAAETHAPDRTSATRHRHVATGPVIHPCDDSGLSATAMAWLPGLRLASEHAPIGHPEFGVVQDVSFLSRTVLPPTPPPRA